jgi:hypothetical protein
MYLYIPNMKHSYFMLTQRTLKYAVHKQSSLLPMKLANLLPNKQMNTTQQFPSWKDDTYLVG